MPPGAKLKYDQKYLKKGGQSHGSMVGQSGQKAPKVPRMKSFMLENIRVSKVSCIKRYAYQKFRV